MTGTQYRQHRLRAGLSQAELARLLEVRRQTVGEREAAGTVSREAELALKRVCVERLVGR